MTTPFDIRQWVDHWDNEATDHAKEAARSLYRLGVNAAKQKVRIDYAFAGRHLNEEDKGYGGRRSALPLDALAGLCAKLRVPNLSSVFWSQETIHMTAANTPDAELPRWDSIKDKEEEEQRCYALAWSKWKNPSTV
jgi:hypothetical protein